MFFPSIWLLDSNLNNSLWQEMLQLPQSTHKESIRSPVILSKHQGESLRHPKLLSQQNAWISSPVISVKNVFRLVLNTIPRLKEGGQRIKLADQLIPTKHQRVFRTFKLMINLSHLDQAIEALLQLKSRFCLNMVALFLQLSHSNSLWKTWAIK